MYDSRQRRLEESRRYELPADEPKHSEDEESVHSEGPLVYERQLSETFVLQILRAKDPYSIFEVRQLNLSTGQTMMHTWLDQETVETVIDACQMPRQAAEEALPEALDAIADYIVTKIIRQK